MDGGPAARRSDWIASASNRLRENRLLLTVSIFATAASYVFSGTEFVAATSLAALLLAALGPRAGAPGQAYSPERREPDVGGQEERLSAQRLAEAVADPLIVFDSRGFVTDANRAALAAFGDVASGISLPLKFRTPEMQTLIERMIGGQADTTTVDYTERVPLERSYRVTATAVGMGSGLFVVVFKDQSEARRIDRMRADFIANASHELRTPLASISGFVETLRGPARNDEAAREQFLQIMQSQTARMARLIDDLLSLSRLEMKAITLGAAGIDLSQIVGSVADSLAPLAAESGVVIENRLGGGPMIVAGDRDELFQVFQNLLENACKYGRSGGRVVISRREATDGLAEIGIEIRDFGPGIAEEHIPRVTERFYRVDVQNSRAQKGTGLGLSIVKHIMTRHRGRLTIHSTPGQGAAFTAWFPAA